MADVESSSDEAPPPHDIRENLARSRIAPDLMAAMMQPTALAARAEPQSYDVIVEFNSQFPGGARLARQVVLEAYLQGAMSTAHTVEVAARLRGMFPTLSEMGAGSEWRLVDGDAVFAFGPDDVFDVLKSIQTEAYAFGRLTRQTIEALGRVTAHRSSDDRGAGPIYKLWRDHEISAFIYESVRTIKCDAARAAFAAAGEGIVWAVADTGVDAQHPHFATYKTLELPSGLRHFDFTQSHNDPDAAEQGALTDTVGHGTHVSGTIAGACYVAGSPAAKPGLTAVDAISVTHQVKTDANQIIEQSETDRTEVSGIAPRCKILSLKVLTDARTGAVSNLLAAIGYIQQANGYGRDLKIHGLNLSLGYPFDAAWFAAGQSPLCNEVDRLVKCGVSVVVAAGNAGYGRVSTSTGSSEVAALTCTIADPGNAELAITVGSTHRNKPHVFGVSYFSAKGPTADGRMKPDLVAPGERIVSCTAGAAGMAQYKEDSGTSMAAPHVSAAIAAFLSVRGEFIGRPEQVKEILVSSAIDLRRRPEFQGAGLLDLMKALQSV